MRYRTLLLAFVVVIAGCTTGPGGEPAGAAAITVQNESGERVSVTITITTADGTVVANQSGELAPNVGRTFELAVENPGSYEITVDAGPSRATSVWETKNCENPTARIELTGNVTDSAWGCGEDDQ